MPYEMIVTNANDLSEKKHLGWLTPHSRFPTINIGKRKYEIWRLSSSSARRLHRVLSSSSATLWTELDEDFTPTIYFRYKAV